MLSRQNRLKKKKDFEKVFKRGKGFGKDFLFLKAAGNNSEAVRIGIIISKKVSKKAVERNKLKRRLRECLKIFLPKIRKGIDIVFVARAGLEKQDFKTVEQTVEKLLKRARILVPHNS